MSSRASPTVTNTKLSRLSLKLNKGCPVSSCDIKKSYFRLSFLNENHLRSRAFVIFLSFFSSAISRID